MESSVHPSSLCFSLNPSSSTKPSSISKLFVAGPSFKLGSFSGPRPIRLALSPANFRLTIHASSTQLSPAAESATSMSTSSRVPAIVDVSLGYRSYPIYIGSSLLDQPDLLQRGFLWLQTPLLHLYIWTKLSDALTRDKPNVSVETVILSDGEQYKDMDTLMKVFDKAIESRLDRRSTFLALGGGVIGDMCGFAAASFLRGVNFIQIPTTVMAQ
ncbi:3-dehydroquinate synthase chloroplastic, partial [Bienertia sinuspersici]